MPKLSAPDLFKEARTLLTLAGPIMVAQFAQTANGFVDTLMAGQAGASDLAAVALGTSLWLPVYLFIVGIMTATTAIVSHLYGADRKSAIGSAVHQAVWLSLPLGLISVLLLRNTAPLLVWLEVDTLLIPVTVAYLEGISWGFPAICFFLALRFYAEGLGKPHGVMVVSVIGLLVNIPCNYVLIFGKLGMPALGGPGCGWATAIVMWLMAFCMMGYCHFLDREHNTQIKNGFGKFHPRAAFSMLKLGLPIAMSIFFEVSIFCVVALLVATLGTTVIAGHQVALNVASLVFMVPLSLSLAFGVRLGHCAGARDHHAIYHTAVAGMLLVLIFASLNAAVMGFARSTIASFYTEDAEVIRLATDLLLFAALFQLSDGLQVGASGALRGLKDTRYPMVITLISYWVVGLGVGYTLAFGSAGTPPMGARGFWIGLLAGLSCAAVLLNARLFNRIRSLKITLASPDLPHLK